MNSHQHKYYEKTEIQPVALQVLTALLVSDKGETAEAILIHRARRIAEQFLEEIHSVTYL